MIIINSTVYLNAVINSLHCGVIVVGTDGRIMLFNRSAERLLNISTSHAISQNVDQILPEADLLQFVTSDSCEYPLSIKIKKGHDYIMATIMPLVVFGEMFGIITVLKDICESDYVSEEIEVLKHKQKELEAILESSYDGIWVSDGEGNTLYVNSGYENISGINKNEIIGKNLRELIDKGYYTDAATLHVLKEKKLVTLIHNVSENKKAIVTASPVFDEEGKIWRVVTNVRDISELADLKDKLELAESESKKYKEELIRLQNNFLEFPNIVAKSLGMQRCLELSSRVAQVDSSVLITGESGSGKGVIANLIHQLSPRKNNKIVKINCGAIPDNLLESELFGYEKGSFTGAAREGKKGIIEQAEKGTLFLDEIGELPLHLQVKLLQFLEEKQFFRVGSTEPIHVDVRIVAATNKSLQAMVKQGIFREDLFFRLNVVKLEVPPLRERHEDILPLCLYYLNDFNRKYKQEKKIDRKVIENLQIYSWPGNVRELENLMESLIVMSENSTICVDDLPSYLVSRTKSELQPVISGDMSLKGWVELKEKELVVETLSNCDSIRQAARYLKVDHSTLVRKIKKYGLAKSNTILQ